jgi:hypothetical protein
MCGSNRAKPSSSTLPVRWETEFCNGYGRCLFLGSISGRENEKGGNSRLFHFPLVFYLLLTAINVLLVLLPFTVAVLTALVERELFATAR